MSVPTTPAPIITGPIPPAPHQKTITTKTFWSTAVAVFGALVLGVTQAAPTLLPLISNPKAHSIVLTISIIAGALAGYFGRQGAVDDAAVNSAAQIAASKH